MADSKRFFWLRLKRDFFKRHDMTIIEAMPNGKEYVLFYLKLLLESVDHEGALRFSDEIPYTEAMLAAVTNTNVDVVRSALKLFSDLKLIAYTEDGTIYMTEAEKHIGSESQWAEKKRIQRAKEDNVLALSSSCPECVPEMSDKSKSKSNSNSNNIYIPSFPVQSPAPTREEVAAYAATKEGRKTDPEEFYTYFQVRAWRLPDGSPVKDWRAMFDVWEANHDKRKAKESKAPTSFDVDEMFASALARSYERYKRGIKDADTCD